MTRTSFKYVQEMCNTMGWNLIRHENLGNAKKVWYSYSITDKDNNYLAHDLALGHVFKRAMDTYRGII